MELILEFEKAFGRKPTLLARGPGRVNLLGEHVDYNAGPVLPTAIDRAVFITAAPGETDLVQLHALDLKGQVTFELDKLEQKIDLQGKPLPRWALYPAGVAWALRRSGYRVAGLKAAFTSDVPIGAGLSSSAALEVAFAVAWQALGGWQADRLRLAQLCQQAENEYVGVNCGLMDQFASAHGQAGHALYFDTRSLVWQALPLPQRTVLVVADSGIRRSLADSAYNERRAACEQAVSILSRYLPQVQTLRDVSTVEFAAYAEFLPPEVRKRAEHVVKEIARVESAAAALRTGKERSLGALMFAGHASLRDLYQVSTPELDTLVEIARNLPGGLGARLTGAGFGGCTVNLVEEAQAPEFIQSLRENYRRKTGRTAQVYLCRASQGAGIKKL
jgi:galactokinase